MNTPAEWLPGLPNRFYANYQPIRVGCFIISLIGPDILAAPIFSPTNIHKASASNQIIAGAVACVQGICTSLRPRRARQLRLAEYVSLLLSTNAN